MIGSRSNVRDNRHRSNTNIINQAFMRERASLLEADIDNPKHRDACAATQPFGPVPLLRLRATRTRLGYRYARLATAFFFASEGAPVRLVRGASAGHGVVPSLMLPPGWVKLLPWLEYVAGRCRNFEYVLIVHETGPRKK